MGLVKIQEPHYLIVLFNLERKKIMLKFVLRMWQSVVLTINELISIQNGILKDKEKNKYILISKLQSLVLFKLIQTKLNIIHCVIFVKFQFIALLQK